MTSTGQQLRIEFDYPDASAVDEDKERARLVELEQAARPATADELAWLKHPDQKQDLQPPPAPVPSRRAEPPAVLRILEAEPEPATPGAPAVKKRPEPLSVPESILGREVLGDSFRIFTKDDNKTLVQVKSADADVLNHALTHLLVAWYKDSPRVDLLTVDYERKRVEHVRCADSARVESVTNWTDRVAGLNLFPAGELTDADRVQFLTRREVLFDYTGLVWSESEPTQPVAQDGGYSIRFKSVDPKNPTDEHFVWESGGTVCRMQFATTYIPERDQTADLRRLVTRTREPGLVALIAADLANERLAGVQFVDNKRITLIPDLLKQPKNAIELRVTAEPGLPRLGQVGRRLVLPSWVTGQPLPTGTCHIAGEGACLVTDKQLWLVPVNECSDAGSRTPVTRLDRAAFDKWDSDTRRHLPKSWQDDAARALVPSEQVAAQAVASWAKQRRTGEWGANPMGLLVRLANQAGGAKAPE
jgi:hypothetical protein